MFWKLFGRKIKDAVGLFNGHFVEAKAFYALEFDAVCCVSFIPDIETGKAFDFVNDAWGNEVVSIYQHSWFDHCEQKMFFNNTIFILTNKRMIELGNNWCQVLYQPNQYNWASALIEKFSHYKIENKEPAIGFARQAVAG